MEKYLVITFESVNFAMQTESLFKSKEIKHQIIPTPREITLSCGLSIRTPYENFEEVKALKESGDMKNKKMYVFEGIGAGKTFNEI